MRAYHFLRTDMTAGSGREPAWRVGEERTWARPVVLCESGYHSSPSWYDALKFAPGPVACLVDVSEPVARDTTKQVSATRRLLAAVDASQDLRLFACDCARRALERQRAAGREPDPRSWAAVEVARRYADGQATYQGLVVAAAGAWAASDAGDAQAARVARPDAVREAARAASAAARAASGDVAAAGTAAAAGAWAAPGSAARDGEIEWQRAALAARLDGLFDSAAVQP